MKILLTLLLLFYSCADACAAISRTQFDTAYGCGPPCSVTWTSPTAANDFLTATVYASDSTVNPTITPPSGWTLIDSVANVNFGATILDTLAIYYKPNAASQSATGNFTADSADTDFSVIVAEYSGVATSLPLDQHGTNTGSGSPATSASETTTAANELLISGLVTLVGGHTFSSAGGGFNIITQGSGDANDNLGYFEQIVSSTGAYQATGVFTIGGLHANGWSGVIGTFKAQPPPVTSSTLYLNNYVVFENFR